MSREAVDPRPARFEGFEGIHLVADVLGAEDAWPVLLMHGGGQTRHAWGRTAQALAQRGIQRIRDFMSSGLGGFATIEEAAEAIAAYTPNRPKRVNPSGLLKVLRQKRDGRWHWHWDPRFLDQDRTEVPREDFQPLFEAALGNIRVPTLLVRGRLSDVVTDDGVREFLARIPSAKEVDVGDAAHMVAGDQNDSFSRAVIDFLETDIRPTLP